MPVCIYCGNTAPSSEFDKEHVVSRAMSGTGANWTLVDLVCGVCNNKFSGYEAHMYQQSVESLARAFHGPTGRGKPVNGYAEPMKLNHLYATEAADQLLYEGGFSLPARFYVRPQLIQEIDGTWSALAPNHADAELFQAAISDFFKSPVDGLTLNRAGRDYIIAPLEYRGNVLYFKPEEIRPKPSSCWLRSYPDAARVPAGRVFTPRMAGREDGKIFVRARDKVEALAFLNCMLASGFSNGRTSKTAAAPGSQQFIFLHTIERSKIYAAILKTGLNLTCHLLGERVARDPAFDALRTLVLGSPLDLAKLERVCSPLVDATDFPPPGSGLAQHRFMIDFVGGQVRFRMRLYGHLAYTAILAKSVPLDTASSVQRVVLDYDSVGIRTVSAWP